MQRESPTAHSLLQCCHPFSSARIYSHTRQRTHVVANSNKFAQPTDVSTTRKRTQGLKREGRSSPVQPKASCRRRCSPSELQPQHSDSAIPTRCTSHAAIARTIPRPPLASRTYVERHSSRTISCSDTSAWRERPLPIANAWSCAIAPER